METRKKVIPEPDEDSYPEPQADLLVEDNLCCWFESVEQDIGEDEDGLWRKLDEGTLSEEEIEMVKESIITTFECGATLRVEVTKSHINKDLLTKESSYYRVGWDEDDFERLADSAVASSDDRLYWCHKEYGYALYKIGKYYVLMAGFPG